MSSPQNQADDLGLDLDLDARRATRAEMTLAPTITLNGNRHELPRELPLDVLEPLTTINVDISVLIRQVLDARQEAENSGAAIMDAVVDMLVVNPSLPTEVVEAIKEIARRLLGEAGYADLVAFRPTANEAGEIGKYLLRRYGVGLGESSPSSDSSEGTGTTSKQTSRGGTTSTSARSGSRRPRKAS